MSRREFSCLHEEKDTQGTGGTAFGRLLNDKNVRVVGKMTFGVLRLRARKSSRQVANGRKQVIKAVKFLEYKEKFQGRNSDVVS